MPYDEALANRVRSILSEHPTDISEIKMFGGIAFMTPEGMACGLTRDELIVRVGEEAFDEAMSKPGTSFMDFGGKMRPAKGMVMVAAVATEDEASLRAWVEQGLSYVKANPTKRPARKKAAK